MSPPTRRRTLELMSASLPLGIAGCLARDSTNSSTKDTRLGHLHVVNFTYEAQTISVEITEDDETVYDDAVDVPLADEETTKETDGGWGEKSFEDYPTEPGAYTVHAWRSDRSREDRKSVDFRDWDFECVELQIHIGDPFREDIESELNIWRTFDCRD